MRFDVFTIFPEVFEPYINLSILKKAAENQLIDIRLFNIRDWAVDKHHTTDDTPFGGGGGMVMKPEPIFAAVEDIEGSPPACSVILLSPQGEQLTYQLAKSLAAEERMALICGRYEGVDERVRQHLVTREISIGDYVLSGGELPALILIEAITRLLPGALGDPTGAVDDSFASGLLEYPHYTRPAEYRAWQVPEVLLSGNHREIETWRRKEALKRTIQHRPEILEFNVLGKDDIKLLNELGQELDLPDTIKKFLGREK
ncbi:MAG: tRNA (guanosine(37)-N1)-methyltransferase TrmD [Chloroflexi bacterium]|nr:tRNA (guanosine(37)-N1)-methyltransferase TrmD [Chloroflexota bacterium]